MCKSVNNLNLVLNKISVRWQRILNFKKYIIQLLLKKNQRKLRQFTCIKLIETGVPTKMYRSRIF